MFLRLFAFDIYIFPCQKAISNMQIAPFDAGVLNVCKFAFKQLGRELSKSFKERKNIFLQKSPFLLLERFIIYGQPRTKRNIFTLQNAHV